ncbi:NAD(P)/FAD-dependent oxidoreductase [Halolamina rubra]|uniref:NAD(P)/FAD-dependent oxidoreductase n=1 Tax=Halolamina rubra TaxID=1380430 RepID=UPI0006793158|nr:NAD(P)/FAD-dependent oxidoreductase [Halolamina rubra]
MSERTTERDRSDDPPHHDVLIVGGGVAGLTAAIYTARAGLDTLVCDGDESILRRNAHLENFPGFPAGVNPRLFAEMLHAQATRSGADLVEGRIAELRRVDGDGSDGDRPDEPAGFLAVADDGSRVRADRVIAASWADTAYLDPVEPEIRSAGSKAFLADDPDGHTSVEGLYAAGRLAERYHQSVVAAGDGARTAITLIHDSETPFYHDWVVPDGYFTDRGREVPPGCEEIDATERAARQAESRAAMREYFDAAHEQRQRTHPSLVDDELGRVEEP